MAPHGGRAGRRRTASSSGSRGSMQGSRSRGGTRMQAGSGARSRLTSVVAAGALAAAALATISAAPANAAVMVSGSTDRRRRQLRRGLRLRSTAATASPSSAPTYTADGAFDIPLEDGSYKLEFELRLRRVRRRVVPRQGRPGHGRRRHRRRRGADARRPGPSTAAPRRRRRPHRRRPPGRRAPRSRRYDATTGNPVGIDTADRNGAFRVATTAAGQARLQWLRPVTGERSPTECYNDKATLATADAGRPDAPPAPTSAS